MWSFICVLSLFVIGSNTASVPITPCKPDDKPCLLSSSQVGVELFGAGIPSLNVPAVDPLVLGNVNGDQGALKLQFHNLKVQGTSKCQFTNVERDLVKSTLSLDLECPIIATGTYTIGGKLLIIPVDGNGRITIKTDKIKLHVVGDIKMVDGADGKKHWKVIGVDHSYDLGEGTRIDLENLYNGDEKKAKPVLDILNSGSTELITEIGKPIINEVVSKVVVTINQFLLAVPAQELEIV